MIILHSTGKQAAALGFERSENTVRWTYFSPEYADRRVPGKTNPAFPDIAD